MPIGFCINPRPETSSGESLREKLAAHDTSDVSDALYQSGTMVGLEPVWGPVDRICGPAVTVSTPIGGVFVLRMGMELCRPGDVLVVSARGAETFAMFGGHVSVAMKNRGVAGVVVDGRVRDAGEIQEAGLPVFARGVATAAASADGPGEVNVPIACAGVVVNPGDLILADGNGIVVVPPDADEPFLERLDQSTARYATWEADIKAGRVFGLEASRQRLLELGCEFR